MTGRQRLNAILNRQPADRLSWTTLIDDTTRTGMPPNVRGLHPLDFYRHFGCDILAFGNYGLPEPDRAPLPARIACPGLQESSDRLPDGSVVQTRSGEWGTLTAVSRHGHPVKYPVSTLAELRLLRAMVESSTTQEVPAAQPAFCHIEQRIGNDGLFLPTLEPSPVQRLIEYEIELENFYALLQDERQEMEELLAAMQRLRRQEYEAVARLSEAEAFIAVENTSSTLTSPDIYRRYTLPHIREYANILHARGKKLVLHMCGNLKALLPVLKETRADAFNAVTPPPLGTTTFEDVLDAMGEDFVIFGGLMDASVVHKPDVTPREIHDYLDALYTPRLRRAHLVLWLGADGLPTPSDRFEALSDWFFRQYPTSA